MTTTISEELYATEKSVMTIELYKQFIDNTKYQLIITIYKQELSLNFYWIYSSKYHSLCHFAPEFSNSLLLQEMQSCMGVSESRSSITTSWVSLLFYYRVLL